MPRFSSIWYFSISSKSSYRVLQNINILLLNYTLIPTFIEYFSKKNAILITITNVGYDMSPFYLVRSGRESPVHRL